MDNQDPNAPVDETIEDMEDVDEMEGEEVEVTREELVAALQEVIQDLSDGLAGDDRETYLSADDLAQNDWFFAGASEEEGQFSVTMWPAEGEEEMLRIDIGNEEDVHRLASSPELVEAMADDFINAMEEDYEEFEEYDEEELEDEEFEDEEEFEEYDEEEDYEDDEMLEEDETIGRDGNMPPR